MQQSAGVWAGNIKEHLQAGLVRGSTWPWFGSIQAGSRRVFLAFAVFQNKLHGFPPHQLHPKYLLLQFSRMLSLCAISHMQNQNNKYES